MSESNGYASRGSRLWADTVKPRRTKEELDYLKMAYLVADDEQEDVYIIGSPRSGDAPYVVLSSQSDSWERDNGVLIQWRVRF